MVLLVLLGGKGGCFRPLGTPLFALLLEGSDGIGAYVTAYADITGGTTTTTTITPRRMRRRRTIRPMQRRRDNNNNNFRGVATTELRASRQTCSIMGTTIVITIPTPRTVGRRRLEHRHRCRDRRPVLLLRRINNNNSFSNATWTVTTTCHRDHRRQISSNNTLALTTTIKEPRIEFIGSKGRLS